MWHFKHVAYIKFYFYSKMSAVMHAVSTMKYTETQKYHKKKLSISPRINAGLCLSKYTGLQISNLFSWIKAADRSASPFFV